ncbi:lipase, putative, partial [Ixodes scapularis]
QLIQSKGYPVQEYKVTTEDGYILEIQRIPWGRNGAFVDRTSTTPVLVQHGILASSADFVNNFYNQSLGFLLADAGYDVWLGNSRGNTYTSHVNLSRKGREFWNFIYIQAKIYFVPDASNRSRTRVGSAIFWFLPYLAYTMLQAPNYKLFRRKKKHCLKFSYLESFLPISVLKPSSAVLESLQNRSNLFSLAIPILYHGELFSSSDLIKWLAQTMCSHPTSRLACEAFVGFINNVDSSEQNKTRLPVYLSNFPAGSSIRNLNHLSQLVRCDCFQKYDFGTFKNKEKYGKVNPPQHKLSNTKLPVAIYWSDGDELVTAKDVARLRSELPNVVAFYKVPDDKFTHLDFAWGITSANVLYREMIDLMDKYK